MRQHPEKQRATVPQEFQAGLPPGILYQPVHVGGSLGFGLKPRKTDVWDQIDSDAQASISGKADLRQDLYDFSVDIAAVSELVLPYNAKRIYLMVQNIGGAIAFLSFGKSATTNGFRLPAVTGFYEPILGTVSSVHAIGVAATTLVVVEGFRA